jgi:ankyrin repeat protein
MSTTKHPKCLRRVFLDAASDGKLDILIECIDKGVDIDTVLYNQGKTATIEASIYGHLEIVQYLTKRCNANVQHRDQHGLTAFLHACIRGHVEIVTYLTNEFHINVEYGRWNALHYACDNGHLDIVQHLTIYCNADVETKDNDGCTALYLAICRGHLAVIKYLINECNANVETKYATAIHRAIIFGYVDVVKYLRNKRNVDFDVTAAFYYACKNGDLEMLTYLTQECHANVETKHKYSGETALHFTSRSGNFKVVQYLTKECHAIVETTNGAGLTASSLAIKFGHRKIHQYLTEQETMKTCFFTAAQNGNLASLIECVNKGVYIETKNILGETALHFSVRNGHLSIVKYLLQDCSFNIQQWITLREAIEHNQWDILLYLTNDCRTDVNARDNDGNTALHIAAKFGRFKLVKHITKICHAKVDATNNEGWTALRDAVQNGHLEVAQYFIDECRADITITSNTGENIFDFVLAQPIDCRNWLVTWLVNCVLHAVQ